METVVRGMPLVCPPKPERLNAYGKGWWQWREWLLRGEGEARGGLDEELEDRGLGS